MIPTASSSTVDIVNEVRERLEQSWAREISNMNEAHTDLRFYAGKHWTDAELAERVGRPSLTVNKLPTFVRQVANDIRQNAPSIRPIGIDDKSDKETARILAGLIRSIELRSGAEHVYSAAAFHTAACGIGHFQIDTEYVDDAAFEQDIVIRRVTNPLSVFWDPAAVKPDRSDAMWCVLIEQIPLATFKERYKGARTDSIGSPDSGGRDTLVSWWTDDSVLVAKYFRRVPQQRKLGLLADGRTIDLTNLPAEAKGLQVIRTRDVIRHKVEIWMVSGSEVLSGPHAWVGQHIPVITIVGEEVPVGDVIIRSGVIRHARDPQRTYNYQHSAAIEAIGQAPKSPWLVTQKMIAKFRSWWDQANVSPTPYLPYEVDKDNPALRPTREAPPAPPTAMWDAMRLASDDIKAVTGIFDASLGARGNETSGKAIIARQREGDVANYHINDNLAESMAHAGRILIDIIPKIYDTERIVRILGEDGTEEMVTINQEVRDELGNLVGVVNDVSLGRFDVKVTTGPGYATKRAEAADSMLQFAQAVPMAAEAFPDLIAKNLDWPGADEIAERLRKVLEAKMPGITASETGTSGSAGTAGNPMQPEMTAAQQPDPAQQQAAADAQMMQLKLEEQQLRNDKLRAEIMVVQAKLMQPPAAAPNGAMHPESSPNEEAEFNGYQ